LKLACITLFVTSGSSLNYLYNGVPPVIYDLTDPLNKLISGEVVAEDLSMHTMLNEIGWNSSSKLFPLSLFYAAGIDQIFKL